MRAVNRSFVIALFGVVIPAVSAAQTFPPDSQFVALHCGGPVMTDPYRDTVNFFDERDVVGDANSAAGYRAFDQQFLYLRMRLDADPAPGGNPRPSSWGFEIDTDGNVSTYEVLLLVDGVAGQVRVFRNSNTTIANSPNDPADQPPVASYPFATHGRSVLASGSRFGNNNDYFLDMAIAWSDLQGLGVTPAASVQLWAGSSSTTDSLNGDLACFDGTTGSPTLSGIPGERGGLGQGGGGGAGGSGTGGAGGTTQVGNRFEGGPSCACSAGTRSGGDGSLWLLLVVAAVVFWRLSRK